MSAAGNERALFSATEPRTRPSAGGHARAGPRPRIRSRRAGLPPAPAEPPPSSGGIRRAARARAAPGAVRSRWLRFGRSLGAASLCWLQGCRPSNPAQRCSGEALGLEGRHHGHLTSALHGNRIDDPDRGPVTQELPFSRVKTFAIEIAAAERGQQGMRFPAPGGRPRELPRSCPAYPYGNLPPRPTMELGSTPLRAIQARPEENEWR